MQFYHRFLTLNNANMQKIDHKFFLNMILTVTCLSHFFGPASLDLQQFAAILKTFGKV